MKIVTKADWDRLVKQVTGPDNVFNLRDLAKAVAAEFDVPIKEAKRVVRNYDRRMTGSNVKAPRIGRQ
jgi:hypothetical protein